MPVIRRLYQFIFLNPKSFVLGNIVMVAAFVLSNLAPFFVKWLTQAVQAQQLDQATMLILAFGAFLFVSNILENIAFYITDKNMVRTSTTITQAVLTHIHNLDFA